MKENEPETLKEWIERKEAEYRKEHPEPERPHYEDVPESLIRDASAIWELRGGQGFFKDDKGTPFEDFTDFAVSFVLDELYVQHREDDITEKSETRPEPESKKQMGFGEYLESLHLPDASFWIEGEDDRKKQLDMDMFHYYYEANTGVHLEELFGDDPY